MNQLHNSVNEDPPIFRQGKVLTGEGKGIVNFRQRIRSALELLPTKEDELLQHYYDIKESEENSLILILGQRWAQKTELALTLQDVVEEEDRGYFLRGSFTNLDLARPYAALFEAVSSFSRQVVERGEVEVERIRETVFQDLENDIEMLVSIVPSFDAVFGDRVETKNKRKISGEAKRFVPLLGSFFAAVASKNRPVVIFLENLGCADDASLAALTQLVVDHKAPGLIFMATCENNVSSTSELASQLRDMESRGGATIRDITLASMKEKDVVSVVSTALECEPSDCDAICRFILSKTKVTPLSLTLLLEHLLSHNMIFGTAMLGWSCNEREIVRAMKNDVIRQEVQAQAAKLDKDIFSVLTIASCLGVSMDVAVLDTAAGCDTRPILSHASVKNIIVPCEGDRNDWAFWSEEIRYSLYASIPENELASRHLMIGKALWKRAIVQDSVERQVFVILSQLCKGVDAVSISKEKEKKAIARLCLLGGQKAAKLSAFGVATRVLRTGISLLAESSWRDEYDLIYSLNISAAEMLVCEAKFDMAEEHIELVFRHARSLDDMISAYCTRIIVLAATERTETAVDTAIDVLGKIGLKLSSRPSIWTIRQESRTVRRLLKGRSDEQLLRLPIMTHLENINAMRILNLVHTHTLLSRVEMNSLTCLKMMQLTLKFGHSVMSSVTFAAYAVNQILSGSIREGCRFAELSLVVQKQHGTLEYLPRVLLTCYSMVFSWIKPFHECMRHLLDAHNLAFQTGDVETAAFGANMYCCLGFESGIRLNIVLEKWISFQKSMTLNRQNAPLRMSVAAVQTIRHFMGLTEDPLNPKGDIYDFDETAIMTKTIGATNAHVSLRMWQMRLAYFFNDHSLALRCALFLPQYERMPTLFLLPAALFIGAMIHLQAARGGRHARNSLQTAKTILARYRKWSLLSPENYMGRKLLIEAELDSVEGRSDQAYEKFICAIACSRDNACDHALANERLARHLVGLGKAEKAVTFFRVAVASYRLWGGNGKAAHLESEKGNCLNVLMKSTTKTVEKATAPMKRAIEWSDRLTLE